MELMAFQVFPLYTRLRIQAALFTVAAMFLCFGLFVHNALRQHRLDQQLVRAVYDENIRAETMLLEKGADPNTSFQLTPDPSSLRQWISLLRHTRSISSPSLLSGILCFKSMGWTTGSEDKTPEQRRMTALTHSANQQAETAAILLIEHGADVNASTPNDRTPGVGMFGVPSYWGTPLMLACMGDCSDTLARLLLNKGAKINAVGEDGTNAFYYAVQHCPISTVELLIKSGANVNVQDKETRTTTLLAFLDIESSGHYETDARWHTVAQMMLSRGGNPNTPDSSGTTPLALAIFAQDSYYTDLLLKYGADPNKADNEGHTPLLLSSRPESGSTANTTANVRAIEALRAAGADPDDRSQPGGGQVYAWIRFLKRSGKIHNITRQTAK